jgi:hypothetical protein
MGFSSTSSIIKRGELKIKEKKKEKGINCHA